MTKGSPMGMKPQVVTMGHKEGTCIELSFRLFSAFVAYYGKHGPHSMHQNMINQTVSINRYGSLAESSSKFWTLVVQLQER